MQMYLRHTTCTGNYAPLLGREEYPYKQTRLLIAQHALTLNQYYNKKTDRSGYSHVPALKQPPFAITFEQHT